MHWAVCMYFCVWVTGVSTFLTGNLSEDGRKVDDMAQFVAHNNVMGPSSLKQRKQGPLVSKTIAFLMYDQHYCNNQHSLYRLGVNLVLQDLGLVGNSSFNFKFVPLTGSCGVQSDIVTLVEITRSPEVSALMGSIKFSECEATVALTNMTKKDFITWSCLQSQKHPDIDDRTSSRHLLSIIPPVRSICEALLSVISHFRWKYSIIVTIEENPWLLLSHRVDVVLRDSKFLVKNFVILSVDENHIDVSQLLRPVFAHDVKAIILCLPYGSRVADAFFSFLSSLSPNMLRFAVIFLHPFSTFNPLLVQEIESLSSEVRRSIFILTSAAQDIVYDSVWSSPPVHRKMEKLYALVGRNTITQAQFAILQQSYDVTATYLSLKEPASATMHIDGFLSVFTLNRSMNGLQTFVLLDWSETQMRFKVVLQIDERFQSRNVHPIDWPTQGPINADPDCIIKEYSCHSEFGRDHGIDQNSIILIAAGAFGIAALLLITFVVVRKLFFSREITKGPYKILLTSEDIAFNISNPLINNKKTGERVLTSASLDKFDNDKKHLKNNSSPITIQHPFRTPVGSRGSLRIVLDETKARCRLSGDVVQMKFIAHQGNFELRKKTLKLIRDLYDLRNENLNQFLGCLTDPSRPALVYECCGRGSLYDVICQTDIKLDWPFKLSLLTDLVRGMKYLHSSPVRLHGHLTSKNCVIDSRWMLKITDYGVNNFYEYQNLPFPERSPADLLWSAPELLRDEVLRKRGTQAGDIYSFSIIMQELIVRGPPYCLMTLQPEEIIEKLKRPPPPLIRPSVSKQAAPPEAINVMRMCWDEKPENRPDFNLVFDQLRKFNHGKKVNIVDTMFEMLEKYSNNLEELIRERTEQLDIEKKKTEQLLNRMLPRSVAEQLKLGLQVDPEEFQEVTIYFSDIVGFTSISARSTPFEVVDLLNDLYTCFDARIAAYNVYKVETIGDAYMVVGGVPSRIPDHAQQVAMMALDLLHESGKFKIRHMIDTPLRLRIGIHTGPCCAGVVGLTMPRYCLFGDTVNTASRLESTGAAWRIHISEATKNKLDQAGGYKIQCRGQVELKGKGLHTTYWLMGKEGFTKPLPEPPDNNPATAIPSPLHITTDKDSPLERRESENSFFSVQSSSSDGKTPSSPHSTVKYETCASGAPSWLLPVDLAASIVNSPGAQNLKPSNVFSKKSKLLPHFSSANPKVGKFRYMPHISLPELFSRGSSAASCDPHVTTSIVTQPDPKYGRHDSIPENESQCLIYSLPKQDSDRNPIAKSIIESVAPIRDIVIDDPNLPYPSLSDDELYTK